MNQPTLEHPVASQLTAFVSGWLSDAESLEIEAHLADCDICCAILEKMPADSLNGLLQPTCTIADVRNGTPLEVVTSEPNTRPGDPDVERASARCPTPLELADHPRYRVLEPLGAGGMGTVYKVEHRHMERLVALKVINPKLVNSPAAVERFRQEVKLAARLAHPNIVTAHDADQSGGVHFLVMEFVEGKSLAQVVATRGPLPVAEACDYARQAALGLQHACDRGMVHRDIKPHNLMLTPQGQVKILDFGLARFVRESAQAESAASICPAQNTDSESAVAGVLTGSGQIMGSVDYIAPEQGHDAHQADIRSDIYSLGCTLYYLLAGHSPFAGGSIAEKLAAHGKETAKPLSAIRTDLPAQLGPVIERMMAKDPSQRFQTPAEVAEALKPFVKASVWVRPHRRLRLAVAASLLTIALGAAGFQYTPAVYRFATNQGELVIEVDDTDIEVLVKENGKVIQVIDTKSTRKLTLKAGKYQIDLTPEQRENGLQLDTDRFSLSRGGRKIVKVYLKNGQLTAKVLVSTPIERQITDYEDFTGRIESAQSVTIIARVSGYVEKVTFRDGDVVQAGQALFVIDPKPFKTLLDQAIARLQKHEAQLKKKSSKPEETTRADLHAARAEVDAAKAEVEKRELELAFTRIAAPIGGRIGRALVARGERVTADKTLLITIVPEDPLFALFDVPEATALRILPLLRLKTELSIRLANDKDYSRKAVVDFVNNRVDAGTLLIRAQLPNPKLPAGHRLLTPGLSLRARLPIGAAHPALLVKHQGQETIVQGMPGFLYLVDDQNKVFRRAVKWGQEHYGLTVVSEGLKAGERVIVGWTEIPRPGDVVNAKLVEMPGSQPKSPAAKRTKEK
jgi:RND family efflux transporter MFP subunit